MNYICTNAVLYSQCIHSLRTKFRFFFFENLLISKAGVGRQNTFSTNKVSRIVIVANRNRHCGKIANLFDALLKLELLSFAIIC